MQNNTSNPGLGWGECGWKNPSTCPKKSSRVTKDWITGKRAEMGVADLQYSNKPESFIKTVNSYINTLYERIAIYDSKRSHSKDDTRKGHETTVKLLKEEFGSFMTEAKQYVIGLWDEAEIVKKVDFTKKIDGISYKTPVYKIVMPIPPEVPVLPTPNNNNNNGGMTAEELALILSQNNNNNNNTNTLKAEDSQKTAYVAGGVVLFLGMLSAAAFAVYKNKSK